MLLHFYIFQANNAEFLTIKISITCGKADYEIV